MDCPSCLRADTFTALSLTPSLRAHSNAKSETPHLLCLPHTHPAYSGDQRNEKMSHCFQVEGPPAQCRSPCASRKHYCINEKVSSLRPHSRLGNACRSLSKHTRPYTQRVPDLTANADRLCDIEDLVKAGHKQKACPYYASQDMAEANNSSIVLCPYNYIIDPVVRRAMKIDVTDSIIVFDEGHNIPDLLRDAASVEISLETVDGAYHNLCALASGARNRGTCTQRCETWLQASVALFGISS